MEYLTDLKINDVFTFLPGQKVRYLLDTGVHQENDTVDVVEYLVLKVNPKSVVYRQIGGRIEWTVKTGGFYSNYVPPINNRIIIKNR